MENLLNKIHFADCLDVLRKMPDGSVDLFLQDPPYNTTGCKWEYDIDFQALWNEWERVAKSDGSWIFTASQPFTTKLINSNIKRFKYSLVWDKKFCGAFALASIRPMIIHEDIIIFSKGKTTYNPQMIKRRNDIREGGKKKSDSAPVKYFDKTYKVYTEKQPESILFFPRSLGRTTHPTEKPADLFRYLIRTYSNPGDVVFDGYGGSGTTAISSQMEGRLFIVCENDEKSFEASRARLANLVAAPYLFSDCG